MAPNRVEEALEHCLDRSASGAPLDSCVAELRPELRREIEALLAVGDAIRQAPRPALPPRVLAANEHRLMARVAELRATQAGTAFPSSRSVLPGRFAMWRGSLAAAAMALLLLATVAGVAASTLVGSAGPGDALYPAKRSLENARVRLAPTTPLRAHAHADVAQSRIDELAELVRRGQPLPTSMLDQAEQSIAAAVALAEGTQDAEAVAILRRCVGLLSYERLVLRLAAEQTPTPDPTEIPHRLTSTAEAERHATDTLTSRLQPSLAPSAPSEPAGSQSIDPTSEPTTATPPAQHTAPTEMPAPIPPPGPEAKPGAAAPTPQEPAREAQGHDAPPAGNLPTEADTSPTDSGSPAEP
jgi:hypothetical protein